MDQRLSVPSGTPGKMVKLKSETETFIFVWVRAAARMKGLRDLASVLRSSVGATSHLTGAVPMAWKRRGL